MKTPCATWYFGVGREGGGTPGQVQISDPEGKHRPFCCLLAPAWVVKVSVSAFSCHLSVELALTLVIFRHVALLV